MSEMISPKWKIGMMAICLGVGAFHLLFNRNFSRPEHKRIELLTDSLIHNVKYEKRSGLFSSWTRFQQLKGAIQEYSQKDSLSQKDRESIKIIDQQLNQLLHERN